MENKIKKVIITGITGQDGSYLAEFLLEKLACMVVALAPAAVIVRTDIDEADLQLFLRRRGAGSSSGARLAVCRAVAVAGAAERAAPSRHRPPQVRRGAR